MNDSNPTMPANEIRACGEQDEEAILHIVNQAAEAYRGVIPPDRWHEPYMAREELRSEVAGGVTFSGMTAQGTLIGVMGIQPVRNVRLIRHAYVLPEWQGYGVGSLLLRHLVDSYIGPVLIGTWAAADWAIRFYQRHGFELVPTQAIAPLLRAYWNVPERQIATSVVLASPALSGESVEQLISASR